MGKNKMKNPLFDYLVCIACGVCYQACPTSCINLSKTDMDRYKKAYPQVEKKEACISCNICSKVCPIDAITMIEE